MGLNYMQIDRKAEEHKEYIRPFQIVKRFSMGRTTVWKYLKEMRGLKQYQDSFLDLGIKLKLVKLADFEEFLRERDYKYLKK